MMEHSLSHLPLLIALRKGIAALIGSHESLPFGLARQCGQSGHRLIPIKVGHGLDNHDQMIILAIDLHLEDAHLLLPLLNLGPEDLLGMAVTILADEFSIVGDVEDLNVTLGRLIEFLDGCSLIHISLHYYGITHKRNSR